jgi:hypothetical protein
MSEEDQIKRALTEIDRILASYGMHVKSQFVRELITWYEQEPERFRQEVGSNILWGGAGSISDISLRSIKPGDERAREDDRRLWLALADLAEALDAEGMATESAVSRAASFRRSNEGNR